jgi:hypothetical protein
MRRDIRRRLDRLEAQFNKCAANEINPWSEFRSALMSIVGFHVGGWSAGESPATALARALDMTAPELKSALTPDDPGGPEIWPMILERLNTLVTARGGRPIMENGSLIFDRTREDDGRRNGFDVLDELYEDIPSGLKDRRRLLPYLADYLL